MKKNKEIVIFSDIYDSNTFKEGYEGYVRDWDGNYSLDYDEYAGLMIEDYLHETKRKLNVPCGEILAIADLGLWNGRHLGYKVLGGGVLKQILNVCSGDNAKFYMDSYNVRAEIRHHDGTNYVLFREVRENANIQPLLDKIYNECECDMKMVSRLTKSLKPYFKKIYEK